MILFLFALPVIAIIYFVWRDKSKGSAQAPGAYSAAPRSNAPDPALLERYLDGDYDEVPKERTFWDKTKSFAWRHTKAGANHAFPEAVSKGKHIWNWAFDPDFYNAPPVPDDKPKETIGAKVPIEPKDHTVDVRDLTPAEVEDLPVTAVFEDAPVGAHAPFEDDALPPNVIQFPQASTTFNEPEEETHA